ncbi:hypothetical protein B296_00044924 [Ensete ventricosum]|uniref:Uncharacterized protein n=1 Tax=Ensete ventricosum TaxID=4639 RepID=A0A426Z992_ENSVE|nr:hypothetical protein B296_00044924 [Ensete ventricosum]
MEGRAVTTEVIADIGSLTDHRSADEGDLDLVLVSYLVSWERCIFFIVEYLIYPVMFGLS